MTRMHKLYLTVMTSTLLGALVWPMADLYMSVH